VYTKSTYNAWVDFFDLSKTVTEADFDKDVTLTGSEHMESGNPKFTMMAKSIRDPSTGKPTTASVGQTELDYEVEPPLRMRAASFDDGATSGDPKGGDTAETSIHFDWLGKADRRFHRIHVVVDGDKDAVGGSSERDDWRRFPDRPKVIRGVPDSAENVPEQLKHLDVEGPIRGPVEYTPHDPAGNAEHWRFKCQAPDCDETERSVTQEDGAVVKFHWWKWSKQPAMRQMANEFPTEYSDANLQAMQSRVEIMHKVWKKKQFLKRPSRVAHAAEVEHALLVTPPQGKEHGWVPVVKSVQYPNRPSYTVGGFSCPNGKDSPDGNCY